MTLDSTWFGRAACRGLPPALFHPGIGATTDMARARAVCATCPVANECLEWAIVNNEELGIWGGLNYRERFKIRRRRHIPPRRERAPCGTLGGYRSHLKAGTDPCPPCATANAMERQYTRPTRAKKKTAA